MNDSGTQQYDFPDMKSERIVKEITYKYGKGFDTKALILLEEIKKHFKDIYTIYGGIHTTLLPDEVINESSVDMICVGEGEAPN